MATKLPEHCPNCTTETPPTDRPIDFQERWGSFPVQLWRYKCECGWIWGNELQRKHNAIEYYRSRKASKQDVGWGWN